jgi:hypothetical protein
MKREMINQINMGKGGKCPFIYALQKKKEQKIYEGNFCL